MCDKLQMALALLFAIGLLSFHFSSHALVRYAKPIRGVFPKKALRKKKEKNKTLMHE